MNIVRIRHLFFPDMPQDYFYDLSSWQVQRGHKVDLITWNLSGASCNETVPDGFSIHRLKGYNFSVPSMFEHYPFLPGIRKELSKLKPEIVHAESHLFLTSIQAVSAANTMAIPSIVTVHGVFANRGFSANLFQKAYIQTLGRGIFKKADLVVCLTSSDSAEVSSFGVPTQKIRIVPNGVDIEFFAPSIDKDNFLIVWVGRFVSEKGIEYLLRAAKLVLATNKNARFLLVGYGPRKASLQKLAIDLRLPSDRLVFAPKMNRKEIAGILSKCGVFVFPSVKEGMPVALLEAMASGSAIVASDIPGVKDLVQDSYNGLLVQPKDFSAIANAIITLLNDTTLRRRLSCNARSSVMSKYSKEKMLNSLDAVYEEARSKYH